MNNIISYLKNGKIVALPTDTVYGLVCDATNADAINRIYEAKGRNKDKALSIFVKDLSLIYKYIDEKYLSDDIINLLKKYWPGALTVIFKKKQGVLNSLNQGLDTIGIRIPNDKDLLEILSMVDFPLAETSCNLSGMPSLNTYEEIIKTFGDKIDLIVEDNKEKHSLVSSTVIDVSSGKIKVLRDGDISKKEKFKN